MTSTRPALAAVIPIAAALAGALFLPGAFTSRAVQAPNVSLDMVTTGNTYNEATNSMTVGTIDPCLVSATATITSHLHASQLIINNVEDLVGWQARLNYIGDKMRVQGAQPVPFVDNTTFQNVGFTNLPIDAGVHRDVV